MKKRKKSLILFGLILANLVVLAMIGLFLGVRNSREVARTVSSVVTSVAGEETAANLVTPIMEDVEIDFYNLPEEYRPLVQTGVDTNYNIKSAFDDLTVSSVNELSTGELQVVLVPQKIFDNGWEVAPTNSEVVFVYLNIDNSNVMLIRSLTLARQLEELSTHWLPSATEDYKFPWTSGQWWTLTWDWHTDRGDAGGNALDFQHNTSPDNAEIQHAVLAAKSGFATRICGDGLLTDPYQSRILITHSDGNSTAYWHVDTSSVPTEILNQQIGRGQYIGHAYTGTAFNNRVCPNRDDLRFDTRCGCGQGIHLHFKTDNKSIVIDGHNIDTLTEYSSYLSTNIRIDNGCTPPSSGTWTISSLCQITGSYTTPGDVIVTSSGSLVIQNGAHLDVDLASHKVEVQPGGRLEIQPTGKLD